MNEKPTTLNQPTALFIGIDWADQKHDCHIIDPAGKEMAMELPHTPESINEWLADDEQTRLLNRLCEQRRFIVGNQTKQRQQLIAALKQYFPLVLALFGKSHELRLLLAIVQRWPDPRQLRRADRRLIDRVLREHGIRNQERRTELLAAIRSSTLLCDDSALITPMAMTVKHLAAQIDQCVKTIEQFDQQISESFKAHADSHLFASLRGAGPALAPRLLCAFGSQRDRWRDADELASFSGIAPITRQSGKQRQVQRRYACPKYLRQTFHEFVSAARTWCPRTKARYQMLRAQGMKHHAAIRKLARSWIRILYRVWQTRIPFDCDRYIETLKHRLPGIIPYLENP